MKKTLRALACIIVVFICVVFPSFAGAAFTTNEARVSLLQAGDYDIDYVGYHKSSSAVSTFDVNMNAQEERLEKDIYNALSSVSSEINFGWGEGLNMAWAKTMMADVINDHPELFYVSTNFDTESQMGRIVKIKPKYSMTASEIASAKTVFNNGVAKALSIIERGMDDLQMAMVIHDYMCDNSFYQEAGHISHSAYGFFYDGKVVCAGYTLAYSYLMNKCGVPCEYVTSLEMSHAWNTIKIKDKWYNVDLTYDNEIRSVCPAQDRKVYGVTRHTYFLKSDSAISGDHHGRDTFDDCDCNNTDYDNAFWNGCYTNIMVMNGNYYYLKTNPSYGTAQLVRRSQDGKKEYFYSTTFYFIDNNSVNTNTYKEEFIRLAKIDGKLVVAAGDRNSNRYIYLVNKDTGDISYLKSLTTYPVGLTVKNNQVVYQLSNLEEISIAKGSYFASSYTAKKGVNYNMYVDIDNNGYVNAKDYMLLKEQKQL